MRVRTLPLVLLIAALAGLVVSVSWALARTDHGGWTMSRYGSGMMGLASSGRGQPIDSLAAARRQAQRFADRLDLRTGEVMSFTNGYYAELVEQDGRPATEVLVDPSSGSVWLEYGPAMMWNTRYGMMSDFRRDGSSGMMGSGMMGGAGMMGGVGDRSPSRQTRMRKVTAAEARSIAQRWLARGASNLSAGDPETFPGYYTLHTMRDGKVTGMMSVQTTTGAVWLHWWHGRFVAMSE